MFDFKEKNVVVTGGSRGIGKQIAIEFLKLGANVVVNYVNPNTDTESLLKELNSFNGKALAIQANIANAEECEKIINLTEENFGTVDILINNAGITKDGLFMRMKEEDFTSVLNVNLTGVFNITKLVIRKMMKKNYGRIINLSSVVALTGNPGQVNYVSSKAGLIGFTKSLAKEVGTKGITVNSIAPGFIETDMTKNLDEKIKEAYINQIPLKKLGQPIDIANACLFIASDLAQYITGQTISVNGGMA